eukprot:TRINITY_DN29637_c0_g1_i3.p1 TRINITY_DN29637_c0_g1~~TRINITY_DN29637_c0_g1_i3.p1  ORF type:complete len:419 (+),score=69.37 TRINITY_DN29637_c0_g1_i3:74-1258(+)
MAGTAAAWAVAAGVAAAATGLALVAAQYRRQRGRRAAAHRPAVPPALQWHRPPGALSPRLRLRVRPTRGEALRCLRGRHLLFVGDSHVRNQFMELVSWLEDAPTAGARRPVLDAAANSNLLEHVRRWTRRRVVRRTLPRPPPRLAAAQRSLSSAAEWRDWADYNANATAAFGGRLCCDCWRAGVPRPLLPCTWGHPLTRDNRYYSGAGDAEGVTVSFVFLFGECGAVGGTAPAPPRASGCNGALGGVPTPTIYNRMANATQVWPPPDAPRNRALLPEVMEAMRASGHHPDLVAFSPSGSWDPEHAKDVQEQRRSAALRSRLTSAVVLTPTTPCYPGEPRAAHAVPELYLRWAAQRAAGGPVHQGEQPQGDVRHPVRGLCAVLRRRTAFPALRVS